MVLLVTCLSCLHRTVNLRLIYLRIYSNAPDAVNRAINTSIIVVRPACFTNERIFSNMDLDSERRWRAYISTQIYHMRNVDNGLNNIHEIFAVEERS